MCELCPTLCVRSILEAAEEAGAARYAHGYADGLRAADDDAAEAHRRAAAVLAGLSSVPVDESWKDMGLDPLTASTAEIRTALDERITRRHKRFRESLSAARGGDAGER